MNLEKHTHSALELTGRLMAALDLEDLEICQDLLDLRGEAMLAFEISHKDASQAEKTAASPLIRQLQLEDQKVMARLQDILQQNGQQLRESLRSSTGPGQQAYNTNPQPSCVDRLA